MAFRLITLCMLSFFWLMQAAQSAPNPRERGAPAVQVYPSSAFGPEAEFQNMAVSHLPDGRLLVANTGAMVLFDGARWRSYKHPRGLGTLWSLVPTPDGKIYGGFSGEIGYFEADATGDYQWHSAMARLPEDKRTFGTVWSAILGREGVWFSSGEQTMLLRPDGRAQVFPTVKFGVFLFRIGEQTWLNDRGVGLLRAIEHDGEVSLQPIEGTEQINSMPILGVAQWPDGSVLIANAEGELHLWQNGQLSPFARGHWPELAKLSPQTLTHLADGNIALGFIHAGPWVLNRQGEILERYGDAQGVPPLTTFLLYEDSAGSLWIAQNQNVVQIARNSGHTRFDRFSGIPDATQLSRHNGMLFAGSLSGLYRLQPSDGQLAARFARVENGPKNVWDLLSYGDYLWLAGRGLERYRVTADGTLSAPEALVSMQFGKSLQRSMRHADRLYFSGLDGAAVIDQASSTAPKITVIPLSGSPIQLAEGGDDEFWVGDQNGQYWRIFLRDQQWQSESFGADQGVLAGETVAMPGTPEPWFLATGGPMDFDAKTRRFVPSTRWPANAPRERLEGFLQDSQSVLWLRAGGRSAAVFPDQPTVLNQQVFLGGDDRTQVVSFMREDSVLWVARTDGVQRIELANARATKASAPFVTELRATDSGEKLALTGGTLHLNPQQRDVRLSFAMPSLLRPEAVSFRSRLVGNDRDWSEWSTQSNRDYTNLPDGAFAFELQARDAFGQIVSAPSLALQAPSPWFRSLPVRWLFAIFVLAVLFALFEWQSRRRQRALRARQEQLEQTVAERTHQLAQQNVQLEDQAARLLQVDELKSRFFANVGHEFRTPLTLVLGPLEDVLADRQSRLAERSRELIELANRNAKRVLDLLVELLDVNRLEHGQLPIKRTVFELQDLVRTVAETLMPLVERHGHTLRQELPDRPAFLNADPSQIERCISNLLSNAVKYTPRNGELVIRLSYGGLGLRLEVEDNGRGISPQAQAHVFDRFFRDDSSASMDTGVGIGLALVREIIEQHGGKVGVQSTLGLGSCFWFELAVAEAPNRAIAQPSRETETAVPPSNAMALSERTRLVALVIDDHAEMRARVAQVLGARFDVIDAVDGPSGLAAARSALPDLIVCDVMMPGFDGVELARRLRASADTAAIALLLLTAKSGSEFAVAGLNAGADDYLSKPFDSAELLARLDALINRRRRLQFQLQREASDTVPVEASSESLWRERLDQVIDQHLSESSWTIEALADAMHTDRTNLFRKVKAQLGMSPSEYLRDRRLLRGQSLLHSEVGSISEIAYAVGFESLSSFSRAYRQRFGCAPSEDMKRRAG